jgi:hypothetical protein
LPEVTQAISADGNVMPAVAARFGGRHWRRHEERELKKTVN